MNGCPWDDRTCAEAAKKNRELEVLQWVFENGCEWKESHLFAHLFPWPHENTQVVHADGGNGGDSSFDADGSNDHDDGNGDGSNDGDSDIP